jgi:hypothetical protein
MSLLKENFLGAAAVVVEEAPGRTAVLLDGDAESELLLSSPSGANGLDPASSGRVTVWWRTDDGGVEVVVLPVEDDKCDIIVDEGVTLRPASRDDVDRSAVLILVLVSCQRWSAASMLGVDTTSTNATEILDVARDGSWELFEGDVLVENG